MSPLPPRAAAAVLLAILSTAICADAAEIVLTDPGYGKFNASALDQPRLYAIVTDPAAGGGIVTWDNPYGDPGETVLLTAFIDTGASGVALSRLHANTTEDVDYIPHLGLEASDYLGVFTETGIGGTEVGDVSRAFGVRVRSGGEPESGEMLPSEFEVYGDFKFWVRRTVGDSEYNSPINLIGMPVIRQRRLHLDPRPVENWESMITHLLAPAAAEPDTQATVPLVLRDFIGDTPPPGEVLPSHSANPLVPNITLREGAQTVTATWLLDTGAGSSFTTFATAKTLGLIPAQYDTLDAFMADYEGPTAEIGGIGETQVVPILNLDRLSVPTREGATLVWTEVDILVVDVAGLEGIFGMNLLVPSVTLDPDDPFSLFDISPGAFSAVVIDTTNAAAPVMRLATPRANGTVYAWLGATFSAAERADPTVGTFTADADRDGLANLIEYALGLDARLANPGAAPAVGKVAANGELFLALSFSRPIGGSSGVNYAVEVSNDLQTWRRGGADVVLHQTVVNGGRETLTYRAATSLTATPRVFLRLAVTAAP